MALTLWSVMTISAGETAYLFSYFINDSKDGLHLAYSYDGLNWTPLNGGRSFLTPAVGKDKLMRDPSICQAPDGTFHMVWTSSWTDRIIGYASSRDLIHWSEQQAIPVMMHEPKAHNCWAPELFYDEASETYYIFWATTIPGRHKEVPTSESEKGLNHRMYYVTTKDFRTFSKTKMFFNPDFSVIDAAIVKDPKEGDLIMVVKNENSNPPEKNLRVTRTKDLAKGFPTKVSVPITGKYWAEGPAPLFVGDALYVYFDKYRDHRYGAVRSLDHGETWEDVSDQVSFPRGIRHGTAFAVDASVVEALVANRAYNPLIPDNLADPSVSKFGDTYYLYGTTDLDYGLGRAGQYGPKPPFVNKKIKITEEKGVSWGSSAAHAEKPLKNLDLYLCVGQSNMAGRGKLSPEVMDTLRNVYLLNAEDKFEPAVNPLNRYSTIGKGFGWQQLGPAYGFAKEMATKKHPIGLIVNARGGSSIRSWVKNAKQSGGYYDEAVRRTKEAMKYGTLKAIIWHQGEADCHHSEAYREKITQLMTDLRNDLGMPDLPVVVGQIAQWNWTRKPHIPEGTKPFNDMIKEISAFLPHSACVSSEGLTPLKDETDPHFDAASQIILGRRYAKEVKKLINK